VLLLVFHRRLRRCVAALSMAGAGLAGVSAVLALARLGTGQALAFTAVALASTVLAIAVLRAAAWALWISIVALGGQLAAVAGIVWELAAGIDAGKAGMLRRLGFDPTLGVLINLVYSTVASLLFGWLVARWLRAAPSDGRPARARR
jgi:hypothetical protein